jgi:hypothetical protein
MLDAYIIDRIRREQERSQQRDSRLPLHIDNGQRPPEPPRRDREPEPPSDRGSVVIDFHLQERPLHGPLPRD